MNYQHFFGLALLFILGAACEDPIEVPSQFEESQLVVDAWLTTDLSPQTITLTESIDYFGGGQPPVVEDATVSVCNTSSSDCYTFAYRANGQYVWEPGSNPLGQIGDEFELTIEQGGQTYRSNTAINRTVTIDSIGIDFEEESIQFPEDGFYAQLYAFDPVGRGDTYWVRAYKNDTLLNRPTELTVVYDATFDAGADVDGTYFITPLRFSITPLDEDGALVPYNVGDHIRCEVHSISNEAFRFLNIAAEQITNEGIFAVPVANSPGNVFDSSNGEAVLGIFNIAEVARLERTVD
ncbi:MAG: DUF4249 domain-containing protein [Bacteroidota bacterium]